MTRWTTATPSVEPVGTTARVIIRMLQEDGSPHQYGAGKMEIANVPRLMPWLMATYICGVLDLGRLESVTGRMPVYRFYTGSGGYELTVKD